MSNSKMFRDRAWSSLKGKYWRAFLVCLLGTLIMVPGESLISVGNQEGMLFYLSEATLFIMSAAGIILTVFVAFPLSVGMIGYFIKNTDSSPEFTEMFLGFKAGYKTNVAALLLVYVKTFLWSLLFVIPGIYKAYEYSMIPYILSDNPGISVKEAFMLSKNLMTGNRWRLFKLQFSFIGWALLCVLTLGIGMVFLSPYMMAAYAEFYKEIKGVNEENQKESVNEI